MRHLTGVRYVSDATNETGEAGGGAVQLYRIVAFLVNLHLRRSQRKGNTKRAEQAQQRRRGAEEASRRHQASGMVSGLCFRRKGSQEEGHGRWGRLIGCGRVCQEWSVLAGFPLNSCTRIAVSSGLNAYVALLDEMLRSNVLGRAVPMMVWGHMRCDLEYSLFRHGAATYVRCTYYHRSPQGLLHSEEEACPGPHSRGYTQQH